MDEIIKRHIDHKDQAPAVEARPTSFIMNSSDFDPQVKECLKQLGYECRGLDYRKYQENGNRDKRKYELFNKSHPIYAKFEEVYKGVARRDQFAGCAPDGTIRSGDVALGIRPIAVGDQHRAELNYRKTMMHDKSSAKKAAEELREAAKRANVDTRIFEGYEDD